MRFLVLGGDAAGMTAASHVRRAVPEAEVVIVERGRHTSYSMCGIPNYIGEEIEDAQDLVVRSPEEFRALGMAVHLETEALAVSASDRTVRVRDLRNGDERDERYDALLYAVGAHPFMPDVPGLAQYGRVVHTLDEGERVRTELDRRQREAEGKVRVVVVGAGYIGLEIAEALVRRGMDATIVDLATQVMASLDPDMAAHVLATLEEFGVKVRLGEALREVRGVDAAEGESGSPRRICTEVVTDADTYPADLLVVATGARPSIAMARDAGCKVGDSGALVVDDHMRTSVQGIWAAGDCVESVDLVSGGKVNVQLGTHANKQGKVAGIDIAATLRGQEPGDAAFPGVVGTAVTKLCHLEIARTGLTEAQATRAGIDHAATLFTATAKAGYLPDPGKVFVKMLAERGTGRVLGAQLIGSPNVAKRIDTAATWCMLGVTVQRAQFLDLSYAPPFGGVWDVLQVAARKLVRELSLSPAL